VAASLLVRFSLVDFFTPDAPSMTAASPLLSWSLRASIPRRNTLLKKVKPRRAKTNLSRFLSSLQRNVSGL